jgi:sortase A
MPIKTFLQHRVRQFYGHAYAVPLLGASLLLIFFIGLVLMIGPAVVAETNYQFKAMARSLGAENGDWRSVFLPNFEITLLPETRIAQYGIEIPKIFVAEPVIANVDPTNKEAYNQALALGIAQAAGTNLPGKGGLGYYFAHSSSVSLRSSNRNAIFYLLGKLNPGDDVYLWHEGQRHAYKVTESKVVAADDLSFLQHPNDSERVVLQTCWPVGTSLKRLLVFADRVEN